MSILAVATCTKCRGQVFGLYMAHKRDTTRTLRCSHCPPTNPKAAKRDQVHPVRKFRLKAVTGEVIK